MNISELKAIVYAKLVARGLTVNMNHRVRLSGVRGFQQVTLDIVALDKDKNPFVALYIGPKKERKLIKYKSSGVQFFELAHEKEIPEVVEKFLETYINKFY